MMNRTHNPALRLPGKAQRETDRHNRAIITPRLTVGQVMRRYEAEPKAKLKVSRFNQQNNSAPRPAATYRAARRAVAKKAARS